MENRRPRLEPEYRRLGSHAHAEILALREAGAASATIGWETASSLLQLSRVRCAPERWCTRALKRLIYGADDPKAGAVHSVMGV